MTYLCPKCSMPMFCVSTASIPPITRYECPGCGYSSKPMREYPDYVTLPKWLQEDDEPSAPDACKNCPNHPSNGGSGVCHCVLGTRTVY